MVEPLARFVLIPVGELWYWYLFVVVSDTRTPLRYNEHIPYMHQQERKISHG